MSRDLEDLLHRTAVEPTGEIDSRRLVGRGRRRRRLRRVASASASLSVLLLVVVIGVGPANGPQQPEIMQQPDDAADPEADGTDESPSGDSERREIEAEPLALEDAGRALIVAAADGVRRVREGDETVLEIGGRRAFPDGGGGVVVQEAPSGPIRHAPVDGAIRTVTSGQGEPRLVGVEPREGQHLALFTRRVGTGDGEVETLHAYQIDDATELELGETGGYESGVGAATVYQEDLLLTLCHLECRLLRMPWGADPEGDDTTAIYDRAMPIHGLASHDTTVAFVHHPLHAPEVHAEDGAPDEPQARLWLHDLEVGSRAELAIPVPEDFAPSSITVDLAADGRAALIGYHPRGEGASRTLLLDDLHGSPQRSWLETDDRVRFDEAAP